MTTLHDALDQLLLDEPPLLDCTPTVIAAGRRVRRRRTAAAVVSGGVALAAVGVLAASAGEAPDVVVQVPAATPSPTATVAPTGGAEVRDCPEGQSPTITADLDHVLATGNVTERGWLDDYVHQHLRQIVSARTEPPALVNGRLEADPTLSGYVVIESQDHVVTTEYVVRDSPTTWSSFPAAQVGCGPSRRGD